MTKTRFEHFLKLQSSLSYLLPFNGKKLTATIAARGSGSRCRTSLDMAERDAALGQVVGRQFQRHLVTGQNADVVLTHLAVGVSDEFVTVIELDTIASVRQNFEHLACHFNQIFFCHIS